MASRQWQVFYRVVNLLYVGYVLFLGAQRSDIALLVSSVLVFLTDFILLRRRIYDLRYLQPLRLLAALLLGPLWLFKGIKYNNALLTIFGLSFIVLDGLLFLQDWGK